MKGAYAMYNDRDKAVMWPQEHRHIAGFGCAVLVVLDAVVVHLGLLSLGAGVAAGVAGVAYIALTTWLYTRQPKRKN